MSEERDVRAYEMGRLKSDDSNLKEGIGFKMESLKTFGYKYQPDTLGFTVKTRSRQTPAMTLWGLQRLLLIFSGLFPSHPQKINYSIRCEISKPQQDVRAAAEVFQNHRFQNHSKMSALLLKLAGDAKVRGTTTHDGYRCSLRTISSTWCVRK